jgi:hypothetical protein
VFGAFSLFNGQWFVDDTVFASTTIRADKAGDELIVSAIAERKPPSLAVSDREQCFILTIIDTSGWAAGMACSKQNKALLELDNSFLRQ